MEVPTPVPKDLSAGTLLALFSLESPEVTHTIYATKFFTDWLW